MPGFADRANDKRYQAYRDFTPGIGNISEEDAYRNYATYYSEGASADTGAKINEFEQFYKASGGGDEKNRAALPTQEEAAPAAAPAAPAPSGGGGGDVGTMAMGGLAQARTPSPAVEGMRELPAPGAANPALGTRIYPMAMRQLAMLAPRVY